MMWLAVMALGVGAMSWMWGVLALPGRAVIRGHVGDVAAVAFVYAVIGLVWRGRSAARAAVTAAIALAIELVQIGGLQHGAVGELVLGRHFDPWDLVAYAVGIAVAVTWERYGRSQPMACPA